ncbi:Cyclin-A2-1 [Camellia lanceoleosa]|uniref:Cyclin-A2-1 n=1 Tax=Camellia lanceoleosa TaxID=1840588 RepID=A0ACC0G2C6_9ERIC|nr:Cyclin-A2-1 [Camellia lanceoleosa]
MKQLGNKENRTTAKFEEPTVRITRARAKALATSRGLPPSKTSMKQEQKLILQQSSKRSASDKNNPSVSITDCLQHKKMAVLKDVTNILCDNPYINCINAVKL